MNALAPKRSINQRGEGRIAKILARRLLDTSQRGKVEELSKQRGAALATLYASYNALDNAAD